MSETPAERFARKQRERDAERGRLAVRPVVVAAPAQPKKKRGPYGKIPNDPERIADMVQREGVSETARRLGVTGQGLRYWMKRRGITACHPVLHAEDYRRRHKLR